MLSICRLAIMLPISTQVALQGLGVHSTCCRDHSVRCFSSFNFSQPTKRDRSVPRDRRSQPPAYTDQETRSNDRRPQQQQWQGQQQPRQQPRQQQQQRDSQQISRRFDNNYLVTCHPGLEKVTAADLEQCCQQAGLTAAVEVTAPGRVAMGSDTQAAGYAAVLHLRSATRVLQLIHQQQLDPDQPAGETVYEATREGAKWAELLQPQQTLGVHCLHFYNNSNVTNSQLVQKRVRDAVCDAVREASGKRPAPPEGAPDLPLAFQLLNDNLQIFRDVGGGSLHRRGYRSDSAVHKAALNEAAAAGLLLLAGWQQSCQQEGVVCVDPMCGSGTLLIEAALMATNTAPGLLRDTRTNPWPFLRWPGAQQQQWQQLLRAAWEAAAEGQQAWTAHGGRIMGNDCHEGALKLAQQAAKAAGVQQCISLHNGQCGDWQLPLSHSDQRQHALLAVCNPPWGLRLLAGQDSSMEDQRQQRQGRDTNNSNNGNSSSRYSISSGSSRAARGAAKAGGGEEGDAIEAWHQLSGFLKIQAAGAEAWVLSGSPELSRHLGMRASSKKAVRLGGQKTMWLQYNIRSRD